MKGIPPRAIAVALAALAATGCGDLLLSKEDRQRIEAVKAAVKADPGRIDAPDEEGQPPLHRAVIDGYSSLQAWLLDRGANPNARNARGETALHVAVIFDRTPDRHTIRGLIRRGADPNAGRDDGSSPLHVAAGYATTAALEALLEGGADPRARSHRGDTPLHLAAAPQPDRTPEDCRLFIQELVARGADPNARNGFGMAPLHQAALVGHVAVVRALLDTGAKVDLEGPDGGTALRLAAVAGHAAVVEALLARGADPRRRDRDGREALEEGRGRGEVHDQDGASGPMKPAVESRRPGQTTMPPLYDAILRRDTPEVARLLAAGADMMAMTADGVPAAFAGYTAPMLRVLRDAGLSLDTRAPDGTTFFAHYLSRWPDRPAQELLAGGFARPDLERALRENPVPLRADGARSRLVPRRVLLEENELHIEARGLTLSLADLEPETLRHSFDPGDRLEGAIPSAGTPVRVEGPPGEYRLEQRVVTTTQIDMEGQEYQLDWRTGVGPWVTLAERGDGEFAGVDAPKAPSRPYTLAELQAELRRHAMAPVADLLARARDGRPSAEVREVTTAVEIRVSIKRDGAWRPIKTITLAPAVGC